MHNFGQTVIHRSSFLHPNVKGEFLYSSFRKPGSGMIMLAIDSFEGSPDDCWMVGDREEDALAAAAAGVDFLWADAWRERFIKGIGFNQIHSPNIHKKKGFQYILPPRKTTFLPGIELHVEPDYFGVNCAFYRPLFPVLSQSQVLRR